MGPAAVCPHCCEIGHQSFIACGSCSSRCFICAKPHEAAEHMCTVTTCTVKPGRECQHMPAKCGNCGGQHLATAANCPMRQRGRTPTVPTGVLRNRDGVVISHIPEVAMVVASRARERPAEKEPAEKEPAAAELITKRLKSSDED